MAHGFTVYLEQYQSISIQLAPIRDEEWMITKGFSCGMDEGKIA